MNIHKIKKKKQSMEEQKEQENLLWMKDSNKTYKAELTSAAGS